MWGGKNNREWFAGLDTASSGGGKPPSLRGLSAAPCRERKKDDVASSLEWGKKKWLSIFFLWKKLVLNSVGGEVGNRAEREIFNFQYVKGNKGVEGVLCSKSETVVTSVCREEERKGEALSGKKGGYSGFSPAG